MDAAYNDIGQWKFKDLVGVFGADPKRSKTFQVKTKQEAEDLFNDKEFCNAPYFQVELTLPVSPDYMKLTETVRRIVHAQG